MLYHISYPSANASSNYRPRYYLVYIYPVNFDPFIDASIVLSSIAVRIWNYFDEGNLTMFFFIFLNKRFVFTYYFSSIIEDAIALRSTVFLVILTKLCFSAIWFDCYYKLVD